MEGNSPFTKLTNNEFDVSVKHGVNALFDIEKTMFSPSPAQQIMFNRLNNLISQNSYFTDSVDEVNSSNCYYYDTEEFTKAKFKSSTSSIFHLNIHLFQLRIDELRILLEILEFKFDIIALSESKLNCRTHSLYKS